MLMWHYIKPKKQRMLLWYMNNYNFYFEIPYDDTSCKRVTVNITVEAADGSKYKATCSVTEK